MSDRGNAAQVSFDWVLLLDKEATLEAFPALVPHPGLQAFKIVKVEHAEEPAARGVNLTQQAKGEVLMDGDLHTDELMWSATSKSLRTTHRKNTDIAEIGKLFTTLQIKRVPVTREGRVTGMVARADLVRVIASQHAEGPQEEGIFGWTLHFDPFKSSEAPAHRLIPQEPPKEDGLSASNFRHLVNDAVSKKVHQQENQHQAAEGQRKAKMKELIDHHLTDEHWRNVLHQARIAAENGEREVLLLQFPHELCSDGGRAINVAEPDWPSTLRGEAAETYLRFERDLKPKGFQLIAKGMSFRTAISATSACSCIGAARARPNCH